MLTITNFQKRQSKSGKEFFTLTLQGGIEMVRSSETGQFYATAKRCSIASTLDEESCKSMLGQQVEGRIERQSCDPYEYTIAETGEVIELAHKWTYVPTSQTASMIEKSTTSIEELIS